MTIAACDASIPVVNPELSALVATNLPAAVNGILLGVMMATGASGTTTLYVPASIAEFGTTWWVLGPLLMVSLLASFTKCIETATDTSIMLSNDPSEGRFQN